MPARLGQPSIDQFLLGAMCMGDPLSHPRSILEEAIDEMHRLRDQGKVRFIGFSCHEPDYAARLLEAFPVFDTVMTPYNFVNRQAEGRLAEVLRKTGAGWVGMKSLVWHVYGLPVTVLKNLPDVPGRLTLDRSVPIARLALQFILANPLIATCVPAVNTIEAVDENVAASEAGPRDRAGECALADYARAMAAEDFVPLAIAGLLEDNLRVRSNAIAFCRRKFNWPTNGLDYEADDAEATPAASRGPSSTVSARTRAGPLSCRREERQPPDLKNRRLRLLLSIRPLFSASSASLR